MTKNDYSKLRPFDLAAAVAGERIVLKDAGNLVERTFVTGPDDHGYFVTKTSDGWFRFGKDGDYRMAPLAWVEGKPVYKSDVLCRTGCATSATATAEGMQYEGSNCIKWDVFKPDLWSWNLPKVKRTVTLHAWLDEDGELRYLAGDQVMLKPSWCKARVPSEDKTVEVAE